MPTDYAIVELLNDRGKTIVTEPDEPLVPALVQRH